LLAGANDNFFTSNLNIVAAAKLVENSDTNFRAAIAKDLESSGKDAGEYLQEVKRKASQYLEKDDICGRAIICCDIKEAILKKGSLAFVTGGISVGKSKIMTSITKAIGTDQSLSAAKLSQERVSVVMVDGRDGRDILRSLNHVAAATQGVEVIPTVPFPPLGKPAVAFDFDGIDFTRTTVAGAVGVLATRHPGDTNHTVLIVDEANAFFRCAGKDTENASQHARELFNAVVLHTKQARRMSVVLVSTDERLPEP
jgi:hypothetical protein